MNRLDTVQQNMICNSGLDLWQRSGSSAAINLTTTPTYSAPDRFKVSYAGTVTGTPQIVCEAVTIPNYSKRCAKVTYQRNAGTFTAIFEQRIEAADAKRLAMYGFASLSFQLNLPNTLAGVTARATLLTPSLEDNHAVQNTMLGPNTVAVATGTASFGQVKFENLAIAAQAILGLAVKIEVVVPTGTDGSTQSMYIGQIMFNPGKTCSGLYLPAGRNFSDEIMMCRRFYEKSFALDTQPANGSDGTSFVDPSNTWTHLIAIDNGGATAVQERKVFKTTKRAAPAMSFYGNSSGQHYYVAASSSYGWVNNYFGAGAGSTETFSGYRYLGPTWGMTQFHFVADSEL